MNRYLELLYEALRSPLGIEVESDAPEKNAQYRARFAAARQRDEAVKSIAICQAPGDGIWLVKRKPTNGSGE
jgi:hypothetical protein